MSNIPKLRFPEFTDAWEKCKLGEVAKQAYGGGTPSTLIKEFWNGSIAWIQSSDLKIDEIFPVIAKKFISKTALEKSATKLIPANSIAIVTRVGVGKLAVMSDKYTTSQDFISLSNIQGDTFFIAYSLYSILKKESNQAQGTSIKGITKVELLNKTLYLPTLPEQQKIGNLFKQLDRLITLHKRKWDDVILLKKALLQKMFPKNGSDFPEIRFPEFTDAWEKCKLGKIAIKVTEKNKDGIFQETLTNSAEFGVISQRDFFDKDISNPENLNGYYIVKPNDFVYNPRISNLAPVGPIKRNQLNRIGIMSPLYFIFRVSSNIDLDFLDAFFSTNLWHLFLKLNGDSGARADRIAIKDKIFMEMPISIPTLPEQQKIGNLFKQLDWLITLHKRQHEHYQLLKKALLQQMFV
ncbi:MULTISPECIES: restriction endonuclease subunit S [Pasteurellaceae]|uniref:restriction endonuclease subunit S n=1 Tax=Pasteurellaceae TaxID=712 RepID=UPI000CDE4FCD|nr:restriction endonuclease subunit S [Avibacterium gallinarum]POY43360.1 restriction endonuclease subunit S [Avibacterium gallinarum]